MKYQSKIDPFLVIYDLTGHAILQGIKHEID